MFKVFEPKLVERTLLPLEDFLIMVSRVGDGDPSFPVHPYIHGISLGPMQLIFVELLCLQEKSANFHLEIDPHDL